MSGKGYTDEFRIEAVKQFRGYSVTDMADRRWIATYGLHL
jgi:hypothetical protein